MKKYGVASGSLLAIASLLFCTTAMADDEHVMLDGISVNLGLFANSAKANVRVNGDFQTQNRSINLDRDLGIGGSKSLPYVYLSWRPWERHEFEFSYYQSDESHSRTLNRDITFRDNTYNAGAQVNSKLSYKSYGVGYRYWAWIGDEQALGVSAGLQAYSFRLNLRGTASISNGNGSASATGDVTSKASTDLPEPYIGLAYRYQMASWARLVMDAGAFKANIGDIDATLYNARFGLEFMPWEHVGIVTQYVLNHLDADVDKDNFNGDANLRFNGAQVLLKFAF